MSIERDIELPSGRNVRVFDTGPDAGRLTILWHHGTPQTGSILPPIAEAAAARGIRVVSCARAGYPGTTVWPGRTVADAASDVVQTATVLGLEKYATVGGSGGGPHALACAALDPDRVVGAVTFAGVAPYVDDYPWFEGMAAPGGLASALSGGRDARRRHGETAEFDESVFVDVDWAVLEGDWASLGADANLASQLATADGGTSWGEIDDDVAFTTPWGFELSEVGCPALVVQGGRDRVIPRPHGEWLAAHLPAAQLWLRPNDGHVSALKGLPVALDWLLDTTAR
ncbi:alpha/beta hydrolase [Planctomonas sp. JC2975]|uniref:alpha/beta fold hydrolase n=1 Tax=Planctomonas sp. JC2975 TaxID=2729626 RepID=UPI0014749F48|nr:alpha/beta hydrolase [Planctomonas sp. JC2975]NNC13680.1 alpha/beta hydrolase [Planctomonas sp. JC2975]